MSSNSFKNGYHEGRRRNLRSGRSSLPVAIQLTLPDRPSCDLRLWVQSQGFIICTVDHVSCFLHHRLFCWFTTLRVPPILLYCFCYTTSRLYRHPRRCKYLYGAPDWTQAARSGPALGGGAGRGGRGAIARRAGRRGRGNVWGWRAGVAG